MLRNDGGICGKSNYIVNEIPPSSAAESMKDFIYYVIERGN